MFGSKNWKNRQRKFKDKDLKDIRDDQGRYIDSVRESYDKARRDGDAQKAFLILKRAQNNLKDRIRDD